MAHEYIPSEYGYIPSELTFFERLCVMRHRVWHRLYWPIWRIMQPRGLRSPNLVPDIEAALADFYGVCDCQKVFGPRKKTLIINGKI